MALDIKLKDRTPISFSDYGTLCRCLYRSILGITNAPTPDDLTFVKKKMLAKYPSISFNPIEKTTVKQW